MIPLFGNGGEVVPGPRQVQRLTSTIEQTVRSLLCWFTFRHPDHIAVVGGHFCSGARAIEASAGAIEELSWSEQFGQFLRMVNPILHAIEFLFLGRIPVKSISSNIPGVLSG